MTLFERVFGGNDYASGLHREALIATGVVLFVFILLLNFCVALLNRGKNHE